MRQRNNCAGIQYVIFLRWLLWSLRHVKWKYTLDEAGGRKLQFWLKHRTSLLCYVILKLLHNLLKIFSRWHCWLLVSFLLTWTTNTFKWLKNMDSQKVCRLYITYVYLAFVSWLLLAISQCCVTRALCYICMVRKSLGNMNASRIIHNESMSRYQMWNNFCWLSFVQFDFV